MKDIYKAINRFPALYKMQAHKAIDLAVDDAINTTADSFVMASILVLVEQFGFGATEKSTRIGKFVSALQEVIDTNAAYYDEAVAEGLRNKLKNLGIEYKMRN